MGLEKLKLVVSVILILFGLFYIYYGEELGMIGIRYEGIDVG